jgi:hypothetical protein
MGVVRPGEGLTEKNGTDPLPPCGGELERGVLAPYVDRLSLTPPSLTLPHKGGGKER